MQMMARPEIDVKIDARIPAGSIDQKWTKLRSEMKLVAPNNKRKYKVLVVGSGLAGGAAAATLGELGYNVECFCFQDTPRRAHSIAAQGGINAAKNYQNDGDSVFRLFYDTIKVAISAHAKRTCTVSQKSRSTLSISAWRKAFRSIVNTVAYSPTARSVVHKYREPSTPKDKPANSC